MKIAIHDASILIDLEKTALFDFWIKLDIETHTTDFIINEVKYRHPQILKRINVGQIFCHDLTGKELEEVILLKSRLARGLSLQDCSTLYLVDQINGSALVTGDGALRRIAEKNGYKVHGLLWILDALVDANVIKTKFAAAKLEALLEGGSRLPAEECSRRFKSWRT